MAQNITQIPAARVPLVDPESGLVNRDWYRFLSNLYTLAGQGSNAISLDDLQLGPTSGGSGTPGPTGATGAAGSTGPAGATGPAGPTGANGPQGLATFLEGEQGADGDMGPPGPPGTAGPAGAAGVAGSPGPAIYLIGEGDEGAQGPPGPIGPQGPAGSGATGAAGPAGPAVFLEADPGEEGQPGPPGMPGINGTAGAQGPAGPAVFLEAEANPDDYYQFPGPIGPAGSSSPAGLLGFAGNKVSNTTIAATSVFTTGGITLASQTATATGVWRIRATGTFTAVSSATVRSAQIAAFWGATQLTAMASVVAASTAKTTPFNIDILLSGSSTTAVWTSLQSFNAITAGLSQVTAAPASTAVTAGAQTLDVKFNMTVAVVGDSWTIWTVTIERLA